MNAVHEEPRPTGARRFRTGGSAVVELVAITPFVLALLAAVWDIREFVSHRTMLARDLYVAAQLIADQPAGAVPIGQVMEQLQTRFEPRSVAGTLRTAVVVRGATRPGAVPCTDAGWCQPRVAVAWPAAGDPDGMGTWSATGGACTPAVDPLPLSGEDFGELQRVLPNEGADPDGDGPETPQTADAWVSRNMTATEWWVVVDVCFDPNPGLFLGRLTKLSVDLLDTSLVLRRRAAWGSVHDLGDCDWCAP